MSITFRWSTEKKGRTFWIAGCRPKMLCPAISSTAAAQSPQLVLWSKPTTIWVVDVSCGDAVDAVVWSR